MSHDDEKTALKRTIRKWWIGFILVLIGTLIAEFFVHPHPHFAVDSIPLFSAWFGFAACVIIVLFSKFLGIFLKRSFDYYKGDTDGN